MAHQLQDTERALIMGLEMVTDGLPANPPDSFSKESLVEVSQEVRKKAQPWVLGEGIQGIGVARRMTAGNFVDAMALKVYVAKKQPVKNLNDPVPKKIRVPEIGMLETDVEEIGPVSKEIFTEKVRPAMPGCGLGHPDITVGTFGALVRKTDDPNSLYILSNAHVLAPLDPGQLGDPIIQPGTTDGGRSPADRIATFYQYVPFNFSRTKFDNKVDAALAKVVNSSRVTDLIRILNVQPKQINSDIRREMRVQKVGRTTDHTIGIVRDVHFRTALSYQRPNPPHRKGRVGFRDLVLCSRFTSGGDSGALVLDEKNRAVGLHFAGSTSSSVFNKISNVFGLLNIELA